MGVYIFDTDVLTRALEADAARPTAHDFGKDIIPALIHEVPVFAHRFNDENKKASKYWRDIGTLDAYFEANMDLCHVNPEFNLYDPEWPLRTYQPQAPPAKFVFADAGRRCGEALDSVISPGCIISGSRVSGSVLCPNVRVHSFCQIEQCILMPGVRVGRHARIRRAIIDRDVIIPRGAYIGYDAEEDRRRHTVTESGVVVVTTGDEPLIGPLDDEALRARSGGGPQGRRGTRELRGIGSLKLSLKLCVCSLKPGEVTREDRTNSRRARFWIRAGIRRSKSTSRSRAAPSAARRCLRAPPPASGRRWNCGTAIRRATSAKACGRRSPTSTARSPPRSSAARSRNAVWTRR